MGIDNLPTNVSIVKAVSENEIQIYPNPAGEYVELNWPPEIEIKEIELIDITGRKLMVEKIPEGVESWRMVLGKVGVGNYVVRVRTTKGDFDKLLQVK